MQMFMSRSCLLLFLLSALLLSTVARAAPPQVDGLWLTDGYGRLLEISGDTLKISEVTAISCLPGASFKRDPTGADPHEVRFVGAEFNPDVSALDDYRLRQGDDAENLRLQVVGAIADIDLHRVHRKPAPCLKAPLADTPLNNFDVFTATYAENYPFFTLKGVNWQQAVASQRKRVTAQTTPNELFDILSDLFLPLKDGHTGLGSEALKRQAFGFKTPPEMRTPQQLARAAEIIDTQYTKGRTARFCNNNIEFTVLDGGVAYLRILSYAQFDANSNDNAVQLRTLEAALDSIFAGAATWHGLVIDVRDNGGGSDLFGIRIANRLTGAPYWAYNKVTRTDPVNEFGVGRPRHIMVQPSTQPSFRGPLAVLIGNESQSAAETQVQALLGRTPRIIKIGQNTQGIFSDVLVRSLPNGWRFGLPNEIYLTGSGQSFDGEGIAPDIRVPVFEQPDLDAGRDPALQTAVRLLTRR